MLRTSLLSALMLIAAPAAAQTPPAVLTIDDAAPVTINDRAALSAALRPCASADRCTGMAIETCDRCGVAAERSGAGFSLSLRTGPPGPFYTAVRTDGRNAPFSLSETEAILASQLDDAPKQPGWYRWQEEDMSE